ncbi:MAG: ABC transporter permease [Myxococcales bacterium FL481]|nr:MAG: ABC transporter permease [Myxococcales bacterium FL481]
MTWLRLACASLLLSPLTTAVNAVLMGLGTASIVLLLLAGDQLTNAMSRDAKGIDLVVGAQGSPVQLILSAVYHADVPPGNIPLSEAQRWADDPRVDAAVPLALGDSFRGFRIVGTTPAFVDLYDAKPAAGRTSAAPMEAVLGSAVADATGLGPGSRFAGAHGVRSGGPCRSRSRGRAGAPHGEGPEKRGRRCVGLRHHGGTLVPSWGLFSPRVRGAVGGRLRLLRYALS